MKRRRSSRFDKLSKKPKFGNVIKRMCLDQPDLAYDFLKNKLSREDRLKLCAADKDVLSFAKSKDLTDITIKEMDEWKCDGMIVDEYQLLSRKGMQQRVKMACDGYPFILHILTTKFVVDLSVKRYNFFREALNHNECLIILLKWRGPGGEKVHLPQNIINRYILQHTINAQVLQELIDRKVILPDCASYFGRFFCRQDKETIALIIKYKLATDDVITSYLTKLIDAGIYSELIQFFCCEIAFRISFKIIQRKLTSNLACIYARCEIFTTRQKQTLFTFACRRGWNTAVQTFLDAKEISISYKQNDALFNAIESRNDKVIHLLLAHPDLTDDMVDVIMQNVVAKRDVNVLEALTIRFPHVDLNCCLNNAFIYNRDNHIEFIVNNCIPTTSTMLFYWACRKNRTDILDHIFADDNFTFVFGCLQDAMQCNCVHAIEKLIDRPELELTENKNELLRYLLKNEKMQLCKKLLTKIKLF